MNCRSKIGLLILAAMSMASCSLPRVAFISMGMDRRVVVTNKAVVFDSRIVVLGDQPSVVFDFGGSPLNRSETNIYIDPKQRIKFHFGGTLESLILECECEKTSIPFALEYAGQWWYANESTEYKLMIHKLAEGIDKSDLELESFNYFIHLNEDMWQTLLSHQSECIPYE